MKSRRDHMNSTIAKLKRTDDHQLTFLSQTVAAEALYEEVVSMSISPGNSEASAIRGAGRPKRITAKRRRLRWGLVTGAAAVAVALAVTLLPGLSGPSGLPGLSSEISSAQAAIDVQTVKGRYVIRFTRLAEDTATIEKELKALGLNVHIDFVPASPSVVGTLTAASGGDGTEEFVPAWGVADHTPAVSIPLDYKSQLDLYIGRPADPGENYVSSPALGAEAPGEALFGSHIFNMKVKDAMEVLQARGLTAEWRDASNHVRPGEDLADSYVDSVVPLAPGRVLIWTEKEPRPPRPPAVEKALSADQ